MIRLQSLLLAQVVLFSVAYDEIVSTRKLRSHAGKQFLDIKCGNLMKHRVIRCETPFVSWATAAPPLLFHCYTRDMHLLSQMMGP